MSCADFAQIPSRGGGAVSDAIRRLLTLAMSLLRPSSLNGVIDGEYIEKLKWYDLMPKVLAGDRVSCG